MDPAMDLFSFFFIFFHANQVVIGTFFEMLCVWFSMFSCWRSIKIVNQHIMDQPQFSFADLWAIATLGCFKNGPRRPTWRSWNPLRPCSMCWSARPYLGLKFNTANSGEPSRKPMVHARDVVNVTNYLELNLKAHLKLVQCATWTNSQIAESLQAFLLQAKPGELDQEQAVIGATALIAFSTVEMISSSKLTVAFHGLHLVFICFQWNMSPMLPSGLRAQPGYFETGRRRVGSASWKHPALFGEANLPASPWGICWCQATFPQLPVPVMVYG